MGDHHSLNDDIDKTKKIFQDSQRPLPRALTGYHICGAFNLGTKMEAFLTPASSLSFIKVDLAKKGMRSKTLAQYTKYNAKIYVQLPVRLSPQSQACCFVT